MGDAVSDKTLTVLVVLTVVISVMSTLAVINAVNQLERNPPAKTERSESGQVALTVEEPHEPRTAVAETSTTGRIIFKVAPSNTTSMNNESTDDANTTAAYTKYTGTSTEDVLLTQSEVQ